MKVAKQFSVRELATLRGVHPSTIRRQLHALNARSGGRVLCARRTTRSPIKTTASALARADRALVDTEPTPEERVAKLEEIVKQQRADVRMLKRALAEAFVKLDSLTAVVHSRAP